MNGISMYQPDLDLKYFNFGKMSATERNALADAVNPFAKNSVMIDPTTPPDRVDFVDKNGRTVGRIVNLSRTKV